jgi:AcrR family transcriptional regulator
MAKITAAPRTGKAALTARKPAQQRSRIRFEALLDAADTLLKTNETSDVGLYDIAAAAGVPPASVYHLFPTKEAAFVALAERYLAGLSAYTTKPFEPSEVQRWQDLVLLEMYRGIEFYNQHPVMSKLFLGENVLPDVRMLDVRNVAAISSSSYARMNKHFEMPYLHNPDIKFAALIGIYDGIWMTSYARRGYIAEDFARETEMAAIAYCETFLPAVLPLRAPATSAAS